MAVINRNRASSISPLSVSYSPLYLFLCHETVCDRGRLSLFLIFNFYFLFFFILCRCMSWGFKNYKAGLLMQSMPMSGIRLGEESDSMLSEFLKEQKVKKNKK